mgnify:CR=1 FL=1
MTETKGQSKRSPKLDKWQERFLQCKNDYQEELNAMIVRENYYKGCKDIYSPDGQKAAKGAANIRNLVFELIEAQVESNFPTAKVTPYREQDEELASKIEDMLRNIMDELPSERLNDMDERTTYIQGGDYFLVEWDNSKNTHTTLGDLALQVVHPRKVIPQRGVESLEKSDYVFIELAQTREYIKRRYGVDVQDEDEESPEIRGEGKNKADGMVTQVICYYRNEDGGIGLFSWVNDVVLEDLRDFQARQQKYCSKCDYLLPINLEKCPYCGGKLTDKQDDYYEIDEDIVLTDANGQEYKRIPCMTEAKDENGEPIMEPVLDMFGQPMTDMDPQTLVETPQMQPKMVRTRIPFYKPDQYPLIVRKNVSIDGKILGNSDVDFIRDQQNETNMYATKISEKSKKGGSLIAIPEDVDMPNTDDEMKLLKYGNPTQAQGIRVFNLQADCSMDLEMVDRQYTYARQIIGITDSFQGRTDTTATSGKAKEFSANQAAGRFESKKVMKRAAYADLYQLMFKYMLAYADEPRGFKAIDKLGRDVYRTFDKYDFLEQDADGEWYWNDRFMFSTDTTGTLAQNREAMWQEMVNNFQSGTLGNPQDIDTLIMYWTMMRDLHYPSAATVLQNLQQKKEQQEQMMQQQMTMQQQAGMMGGQPIQ